MDTDCTNKAWGKGKREWREGTRLNFRGKPIIAGGWALVVPPVRLRLLDDLE